MGHDIFAHLTESLSEVAWELSVQKVCLRPRAGDTDEAVIEIAAWQLNWTGSEWRIGPRLRYEVTPKGGN